MIQFVDDSPQTALADCIADYQSIAGRTLGNGDPEMLLINAFSYRLSLARKQMNYVGNQNLISFASGLALEQIGMKFGTFRLDASSALVTVTFSITAGAPTLVIPAGIRVKSQDGAVTFQTIALTNVSSGTPSIDVDCICLATGVIGNGYTPGLINNLVDPIAYVTGAVNDNTSTGGSDQETDDQLRVRIPLANATFSVAGPVDAYKYFAKSADASIVDVSVMSGVVAGQIATSALHAGGNGYLVGDLFTVNGGTLPAAGKVVTVLAAAIHTYSLDGGGTGYAVNDTFTVNGGGVLATGKVLTVSGSTVTAFAIITMGAGYSTGSGISVTNTLGSGIGLTINILTIADSTIVATYAIINKGSGYSTGSGVATTTTTGAGAGLKIDISTVISLMTVKIYPLQAGGVIPNTALLDAVVSICSDKKVRPLTDNVMALAPTAVNYNLTVNLTLKKNAPPGTQGIVLTNLNGFVNQWSNALGVDLILNQFRGQCMVPGVYNVDIPSFTADVTIADNEFGNCTGVVVNVASVVDEP